MTKRLIEISNIVVSNIIYEYLMPAPPHFTFNRECGYRVDDIKNFEYELVDNRRGFDRRVIMSHYSESSNLVYFNGRSSSLRSSNLRLAFGGTLLGRPSCCDVIEEELFSRRIFVASFDSSDIRRVKRIHFIDQWWHLTFLVSSVQFGP